MMTSVEKIMRRDVVPVHGRHPIHTARRHMIAQGLAALPVVDADNAVLGILTEGDLLVRCLPRRALPWWEFTFGDSERLAREYRKSMGTTVGEVMTPVSSSMTVHPEDSVEEAAVLMRTTGLPLLLVVADGVFRGVLTRADLIDEDAGAARPESASDDPGDLPREMERRMREEPWVSTHTIRVEADRRLIRLYGLVRSEAERAALITMARAIHGCTGVESHLLVHTQLAYI